MQEVNLFAIYTDIHSKNGFKYFITGSVASIIYGEPRLTHAIDLVIYLLHNEVDKFIRAFPPEQFYCPPEDIIIEEINRESKGHFNIIHHATGFKAYFYLIGNDPFQKWAMDNKKSIRFYDKNIFIAPPEYLIIKKLEFYKEGNGEKHLLDIKAVVEYSGSLINNDFLMNQINKRGLYEFWSKLEIGNQ